MSHSQQRPLRIATRASALALWQARHVAALIGATSPETTVEIVHVTTSGDSNQADSLRSFGGLGVFTREVQRAVLDGRADVAVHSLKDLPTEPAAGLVLAAVPEREETADALILTASHQGEASLTGLPSAARIGTGSLRRRAQLLNVRPDLEFAEARGNVETRLRKLDEGQFAGLILALAGLKRLGLESRISCRLEPPVVFAAVGQGALGIECRADDAQTRALLSGVDHPSSRARVTAERTLLAQLRAGCHAPVGADTRFTGGGMTLEAVVLSPDGRQRLIAEKNAPIADARQLGIDVADILLRQGAEALMTGA